MALLFVDTRTGWLVPALSGALALLVATGTGAAATGPCPQPLTVPLASERDQWRCDLESGLELRVVRAPVNAASGGWEIVVVAAGQPSGPNLLYHSTGWHGPYPTQVMAWHEGQNLFPRERVLAVRGHALEVVIRVIAPEVSGRDGRQIFTAGRIEISVTPVRQALPERR